MGRDILQPCQTTRLQVQPQFQRQFGSTGFTRQPGIINSQKKDQNLLLIKQRAGEIPPRPDDVIIYCSDTASLA